MNWLRQEKFAGMMVPDYCRRCVRNRCGVDPGEKAGRSNQLSGAPARGRRFSLFGSLLAHPKLVAGLERVEVRTLYCLILNIELLEAKTGIVVPETQDPRLTGESGVRGQVVCRPDRSGSERHWS
jgi:hypothetical protein